MKRIMLFLPLFLLLACNDEHPEEVSNDFSGYYSIQSISADMEVDMNNDGRGSTDILAEMCLPQVLSDGEVLEPYFKKNSWNYIVEVRPGLNQIDSGYESQLISFNFPRQHIGWMQEEPNRSPYLGDYLRSMLAYRYEFTETDEVAVISLNPEYNIREAIIHSLVRTSKETFVLTFSTRLFNFLTEEWEPVNLAVSYERTEWGSK